MNLSYGKILISSYRKTKIEQSANRARLKNARGSVSYTDLQDLEQLLFYNYDSIVKDLEEEINIYCKTIPVYRKYLSDIEGISQDNALELLVHIKDISRFDTVSKLYSYLGLAPIYYCHVCNKRYFEDKFESNFWAKNHLVDHRLNAWDYVCSCSEPKPYHASNRKMKDMIPDYNEQGKKIAIVIGDKLSKYNDFYKNIFTEYRRKELLKQLTSVHADNRARRKVAKLFLLDLFNNWRKIEGLEEVREYRK